MNLRIAAFNHLLNQQPALRDQLARLAGRRIGLNLPPFELVGVVTDAGWLADCAGEPEARLRLKHGVALARLAGREPALADVTLEGDAELAAALGRIVRQLRWDAGEDLSRLVGDVAAQRLETLARGVAGFKGQLAWRLAENWAEHLREEAPLLAKPHQVTAYVQAVDRLRDDTSRLEKRLARLEAAFQTQNIEA